MVHTMSEQLLFAKAFPCFSGASAAVHNAGKGFWLCLTEFRRSDLFLDKSREFVMRGFGRFGYETLFFGTVQSGGRFALVWFGLVWHTSIPRYFCHSMGRRRDYSSRRFGRFELIFSFRSFFYCCFLGLYVRIITTKRSARGGEFFPSYLDGVSATTRLVG